MLPSQNLSIRKADSTDAEALIELITALAEFERLPPPDEEAQARLIAHGFGDRPKFEAYLAQWDDAPQPIGYAFVFETYSTFLARPTLYLEDLFVLPEYRQRGIGKALLRFCMALAQARDCGRMEWTCLDWNVKAQQVYEGMGAKRMKEWDLYRLTQEEIDAFLRVSADPAEGRTAR
jgi:GNAT superfamily N-acetyltransferase